MTAALRKLASAVLLSSWGTLFVCTSGPLAQEHVIGTAELHQTIVAVSESRQQNLTKVQEFFSSISTRRALQSAKIDIEKVKEGIPLLDDEELARLAAQTEKILNDIAGGALTNQQITYIIIALATAVVILIIIAA